MDQTPSAVEEFRLAFLSCLRSFSIGFSSDMDKPATAESTLVKGTDMLSGSDKLAEMDEDGREEIPKNAKMVEKRGKGSR